MRWMVPFLALVALAPVSLTGQVLPGATGRERGTIRAEFLDAVMLGVRTTGSLLQAAWYADDADAAAALYHEDAFLVTADGDVARGRPQVLAYLRDTLPASGHLETSLLDVDASNNMAVTVERFVLGTSEPGGRELRGLLFTVYLSDGRTWKIRSQIFRAGVGDGT